MKTFREFMSEDAKISTDDYKNFGEWLNSILSKYNYQVAPKIPAGKPGKNVSSMREYRLQLIVKSKDTSDQLIKDLKDVLEKSGKGLANIEFNRVSPNSSKFPSYSFEMMGKKIDLVIGRGANKGENFETKTVEDLASAIRQRSRGIAGGSENDFTKLLKLLDEANPEFASREIKDVQQRKGSTKKEGVPIEKLGEIIGDMVLTDTTGHKWFISLKDINGDTFSSYSGASTLFNAAGDLQEKSPAAEFLNSFGVDLNEVQAGFDIRKNKKVAREEIEVQNPDKSKIEKIFARAWGMNYFYVRKTTSGWKVFWIDKAYLNKLIGNIRVTQVKYPSKTSKQISIFCENSAQKYIIEFRNSKGGEYPNDVKFKVR